MSQRARLGRSKGQTITARSRGLTLLELLVVLTILLILIALVPPAIRGQLSGLRLERSTSTVVSALRSAQAQAISRNIETGVQFDLAQRTYGISDNGRRMTRELPDDVHVRIVTGRAEIAGPSTATIRFYPDGTSTGGEVHLSSGGSRMSIDVSWISGAVRIRDTAST